MKILLTNDDGYRARGLEALVEILRPYGDLTVVAPKYHQSATSMAVTMGLRPIAVKKLSEVPGERWWYVDGTPASCVKFALTEIFGEDRPDIVVSGINHGGNYATAALYSGTLGAAEEAALVHIPAMGLSIDDPSEDADFSPVAASFPAIFEFLANNPAPGFGVYYNLNFPAVRPEEIRGIRIASQGVIRWVREFSIYDYGMFARKGIKPADIGLVLPQLEEGETPYLMAGDVSKDPGNGPDTDVELIARRYITVSAHNLLTVDAAESQRLLGLGLENL